MNPISQPIDLFGIAPTTRTDVQLFDVPNETASPTWQTWYKPRGATMCSMIAIGGGGGGGGGATTGGGGGGSSGIARLVVPAFFLPDVLYVQVGVGGAGTATNGSAGAFSYISFGHSNTAPNVLLQSNAVAPTGATGATAGAAGTISVIGSFPFATLGSFFAIAGQAGSAGGGTNAVGTVVSAWTSVPLSGGPGGSGNGGAGRGSAAVNAAAAVDWGEGPVVAAGSAITPAAAAAGATGIGGFARWTPLFQTAGTACGSTAAATFTSGWSGIGCGGAGGSAANNLGADGGDGLVVIFSW